MNMYIKKVFWPCLTIQAAARDLQRDSALLLMARSPCAAFLSMAARRETRISSSLAAFLSMVSCLKTPTLDFKSMRKTTTNQ